MYDEIFMQLTLLLWHQLYWHVSEPAQYLPINIIFATCRMSNQFTRKMNKFNKQIHLNVKHQGFICKMYHPNSFRASFTNECQISSQLNSGYYWTRVISSRQLNRICVSPTEKYLLPNSSWLTGQLTHFPTVLLAESCCCHWWHKRQYRYCEFFSFFIALHGWFCYF